MFHFFSLYLFFVLAPDDNPTGVHGFGTEHNNLVISWKVIKSVLILKHLVFSRDFLELSYVLTFCYHPPKPYTS